MLPLDEGVGFRRSSRNPPRRGTTTTPQRARIPEEVGRQAWEIKNSRTTRGTGTNAFDNTRNRLSNELLARLRDAGDAAGVKILIQQGSYTSADPDSKATHEGGGAFDLYVDHMDRKQQLNLVEELRKRNLAAWLRTPEFGWADAEDPHIHGIQIDAPDLSPVAAKQVESYKAGRSGLASGAPDPHPRPPLLPAWGGLPSGDVNTDSYEAPQPEPAPPSESRRDRNIREREARYDSYRPILDLVWEGVKRKVGGLFGGDDEQKRVTLKDLIGDAKPSGDVNTVEYQKARQRADQQETERENRRATRPSVAPAPASRTFDPVPLEAMRRAEQATIERAVPEPPAPVQVPGPNPTLLRKLRAMERDLHVPSVSVTGKDERPPRVEAVPPEGRRGGGGTFEENKSILDFLLGTPERLINQSTRPLEALHEFTPGSLPDQLALSLLTAPERYLGGGRDLVADALGLTSPDTTLQAVPAAAPVPAVPAAAAVPVVPVDPNAPQVLPRTPVERLLLNDRSARERSWETASPAEVYADAAAAAAQKAKQDPEMARINRNAETRRENARAIPVEYMPESWFAGSETGRDYSYDYSKAEKQRREFVGEMASDSYSAAVEYRPLTLEAYDALSREQRLAVDFNGLLYAAREKDLARDVSKIPEERLEKARKDSEKIFGKEGGSALPALSTIALLKRINWQGVGQDLDEFLSMERGFDQNEILKMKLSDKEMKQLEGFVDRSVAVQEQVRKAPPPVLSSGYPSVGGGGGAVSGGTTLASGYPNVEPTQNLPQGLSDRDLEEYALVRNYENMQAVNAALLGGMESEYRSRIEQNAPNIWTIQSALGPKQTFAPSQIPPGFGRGAPGSYEAAFDLALEDMYKTLLMYPSKEGLDIINEGLSTQNWTPDEQQQLWDYVNRRTRMETDYMSMENAQMVRDILGWE